MAGQAGTIGGSFLELRRIINRIKDKSRIGICLDTCHAFAAGQSREKYLLWWHSGPGNKHLKIFILFLQILLACVFKNDRQYAFCQWSWQLAEWFKYFTGKIWDLNV